MKKEVKVAIFGICILALTYWGISFLKGFDILRPHNSYHISYEKSDNIEVSSPVLLKGIKIGTVVAVTIEDVHGNVNVTVEVKRKYKIPSDSKAMISNKSVLGGKAIFILIGDDSEILTDGGSLTGTIDNNMTEQIDEVKTKMFNAVDRLSETLEGINKLLDSTNILNLSSIIANINDVSGNVNDILVNEKQKISSVVSNLDSVTRDLKNITPQLNNVVANISTVTDSLSTSLPLFVNNANVTISEINETIKAINDRKGSLGKLVYDPMLYDNLSEASDNLSILLSDLKQNPKRYVSFSLFGKRDKTPKTNNVK